MDSNDFRPSAYLPLNMVILPKMQILILASKEVYLSIPGDVVGRYPYTMVTSITEKTKNEDGQHQPYLTPPRMTSGYNANTRLLCFPGRNPNSLSGHHMHDYLIDITADFIHIIRNLQRHQVKRRFRKLALFVKSNPANLPNDVLKLIIRAFYNSYALSHMPQSSISDAKRLQQIGSMHV